LQKASALLYQQSVVVEFRFGGQRVGLALAVSALKLKVL
jgi:hypothetical protein